MGSSPGSGPALHGGSSPHVTRQTASKRSRPRLAAVAETAFVSISSLAEPGLLGGLPSCSREILRPTLVIIIPRKSSKYSSA